VVARNSVHPLSFLSFPVNLGIVKVSPKEYAVLKKANENCGIIIINFATSSKTAQMVQVAAHAWERAHNLLRAM
jgi:hypothetical protein